VTVTAGLISHKIPCFGYIIKEADKAGMLLEEVRRALSPPCFLAFFLSLIFCVRCPRKECKKRGLPMDQLRLVKMGEDAVARDGTIVKAVRADDAFASFLSTHCKWCLPWPVACRPLPL
jgi:hypothetical protein